MVIVERMKKCLDFAATIHIVHFLMGMTLYGFPRNWLWWLLNLICLVIMVTLSEYLCRKRELAEIPVGKLAAPSHVTEV